MRKILILCAITMLVLLPSALAPGCVREPTASEIINNMGASLDEVDTYQFDMDMTLDMAGAAEGQKFEITMVSHMTGAIDNAVRNMRMDMDMSTKMLGMELPSLMEMHTIIVDGDFYVWTKLPETEIGWIKEEIASEQFDEMWRSSVQSQVWLDIVQQSSEAEFLGRDITDGVDCYVVSLVPDAKEFWQAIMQQPGMNLTEEGQELPIKLEEMFEDMSFKWWVCKDTWLPVKGQVSMTMVLSSDLLKLELPPEQQFVLTMPVTADLSFHDYNEAIVIDVPLAIGPLELCSNVTESGEYTIRPEAIFHRGEDFWIYAEVTGFEQKKLNGGFDVWLVVQHVRVSGPSGEIIAEERNVMDMHVTLTEEEPMWFALPLGPAGRGDPLGQYTIELSVQDMLSHEWTYGVATFILQ